LAGVDNDDAVSDVNNRLTRYAWAPSRHVAKHSKFQSVCNVYNSLFSAIQQYPEQVAIIFQGKQEGRTRSDKGNRYKSESMKHHPGLLIYISNKSSSGDEISERDVTDIT